jgi:hypothetical protein
MRETLALESLGVLSDFGALGVKLLQAGVKRDLTESR